MPPYNPAKAKPITELTGFEILVRELRAAGMSVRDMHRGLAGYKDAEGRVFPGALTRNVPTVKDINAALEASGADPRRYIYTRDSAGRRRRARNPEYVTDTLQLYTVVGDPDIYDARSPHGRPSGTTHPEWLVAKRIQHYPKGTKYENKRYPTFADNRRHQAKLERENKVPKGPGGAVDRLVENYIVGHIFRTAQMSRKYDVLNNQLSDRLQQWFERHARDPLTTGSP